MGVIYLQCFLGGRDQELLAFRVGKIPTDPVFFLQVTANCSKGTVSRIFANDLVKDDNLGDLSVKKPCGARVPGGIEDAMSSNLDESYGIKW